MTGVVAAAVFACLLAPPAWLLAALAWLLGGAWLALGPLGVWLGAAGWLGVHVARRCRRRGAPFIDALVAAPGEVRAQLLRLPLLRRWARPGLELV